MLSIILFFFVISGHRWFRSGATGMITLTFDIQQKLSGLSHNFKAMQICKYCYILMRNWKYDYSVLKIYMKMRVCIHYFGFMWLKVWSLVSDCFECRGFNTIEMRYDCSIFWFQPFNLQNGRYSNIEIYVSPFTSSCHIVNGIHWSVVCSVDKLQQSISIL